MMKRNRLIKRVICIDHKVLVVIRSEILPIWTLLSTILVLIINPNTSLRIMVLIPLSITFIMHFPFCLQRMLPVSKNGFCVGRFDYLLTYGAQSPKTTYLKLAIIVVAGHLLDTWPCTKLLCCVVCISALLRLNLIDHFCAWKGLEFQCSIALICDRSRWSTPVGLLGSFDNDCRSNLRMHFIICP